MAKGVSFTRGIFLCFLFKLSLDGYLTTGSDNTTLNTHTIKYMWYDYLAFFSNDFNVTDESKGKLCTLGSFPYLGS